MSDINVQQFVNAVINWAAQRDRQFTYNWPVKGGWEGWVQVDLTAFILAADSTIDILREQPVYANPLQRCDLLLNTGSAAANQVIVEVKAESFQNVGAFVPGVVDDLDKLENSVAAHYAGTSRVMLALAFSQPSFQQVLGIRMNGHRIFVPVNVGDVACLVAVRTPQGWVPADQLDVPAAAGSLPYQPTPVRAAQDAQTAAARG